MVEQSLDSSVEYGKLVLKFQTQNEPTFYTDNI